MDAIVIGSGFGGAVVAARLVDAGFTVTVVERGPWRDTAPVQAAGIAERAPLPRTGGMRYALRTLHLPFGPARGLTINRHGLLELRVAKTVKTVCASAVGGGSHIWAALMARPPADYWDGRAHGVSSAMMAGHYDRVFRELGAAKPRSPATVPNYSSHAWQDQSFFSAISEEEQPYMGFHHPRGDVGNVMEQGAQRPPVDYGQSNGIFGSPTGAKAGVDACYLVPALGTGKLTVLASHEAHSVAKTSDGHYRVVVTDLRRNTNATLSAPVVIVAAGTMNTLRLLFESRDQGLLDGMPALGNGFGTNGDCMASWTVNDTPVRDSCLGTPSYGRVKIKGHEDTGYVILAAGEPPPVPTLLRNFVRRSVARTYQVIGMGQDAADGKVTHERGRLNIAFNLGGSPIYRRLFEAFGELGAQSGWRLKFNEKSALVAHAMGGCRIADEASRGVVDGSGEVHGHTGLYVADASVFPQPVGVPPSMSIAAWASHVGDIVARRLAAVTR